MARGALTAEEDEAPALKIGCSLRMKILIVPAEVFLWFRSAKATACSASARAGGHGRERHLPPPAQLLGFKGSGLLPISLCWVFFVHSLCKVRLTHSSCPRAQLSQLNCCL